MPSIDYHYLRALQLEGRHPADAGIWGQTVWRLELGEGLAIGGSPWSIVTFGEGEPLPVPPQPPPSARWRTFYYRRIRSSAECVQNKLFNPGCFVGMAFHLTAAWANPPGGVIPPPSDSDQVLRLTHAATLMGPLSDRRLLHFRLKWPTWGDNGTGYMPYEYFDRYVFECWAIYPAPQQLKLFQWKTGDGSQVRWHARDEADHRIYAFEVRDSRLEEKHAWAFVIERDGALEVEELYVRPEYRRLGHGRWLAERVAQLAREKGLPLRVWVGFVDCKAESKANYPALVATARRLGVEFKPCPVQWAAYFGTTEGSGQSSPVEPEVVPARPRTPRQQLLAAVMALGLGQALPAQPLHPSQGAQHASVADLEVGSFAWEKLVERRRDLIDKMYTPGERLSEEERLEYDWLQRATRAAVARSFPPSKLSPEELAVIKSALGIRDDAGAK